MLKKKPVNMNSKRSINLIVDTMLSLLSDKMFSNITISELTKEAGIVRNTFYAYFECKDDVLTYYMYDIFRKRIQLALMEKEINELDLVLLYFEIWADNLEFLNMLKRNQLLHLLSQFGDQFNLICEEFEIFDYCDLSKEAEKYVDTLYADALASIVKRWMKTSQKETPIQLSKIFWEFFR